MTKQNVNAAYFNVNSAFRALDCFASTELSLHRYKDEFSRKTAQIHTGSTAHSDATRTSENTTLQSDSPNPLALESDLNHFKELFSKLKFSYLEQETKEKYLKALLEDPPQFVDQAEINEQEEVNIAKKTRVKERKKEVKDTESKIIHLAKQLDEDYTDLSTQVHKSQQMIKEIQEMEEELAQLLEGERENEQQIPLSDLVAMAEKLEAEESEFASELSKNKSLIEEMISQLETLQTQERHVNLKKGQIEAMAQDALRVRASENLQSRNRKEEIGKWYCSMLNLMQQTLSIKSFEIHLDKEAIDIVFESKAGLVPICVLFHGKQLLDVQLLNGVNYDNIIQEAKRRNDFAYAITQIRIALEQETI